MSRRVVRPPIYPKSGRVIAATGPLTLRPNTDLSGEIMNALFGAPKRVRMGPFPWTKRGGRNMEPIIGSVLQVMPAQPGWSVLFALESDEKAVWEEPIIGWAIVVIWTTPDPAEGEPDPKRREYQTEVQPYTISQDGVAEVPCMREGVLQLAVLQAGQIRIAREPA